MKLTEIIHIIEKTAPLNTAASWDASGMQVAATRQDVARLAVCLDPTPASVDKALKSGAGLILSHHPLSLRPRLPSKIDALHQVLSLLFRHDAALYAAHTSLDVNPEGPVGWLAHELTLRDARVLEPVSTTDVGVYGFGLVGELPAPLSPPALLERLGVHISLVSATLCGPLPKYIRRLAYCTGSGTSLLDAVVASEADIFITGDVKYHTALETTVCILDVGHHSLEEEMMRRFAALLAPQLPGVTVDFISSASPLRPAVRTVM